MWYFSRTIISGRQSMFIIIATFVLMALMAINPRIAEIFLAFWLGGAVPGTNIVIPPDAILGGIVAMTVSCFIILMFQLRLSAQRKKYPRHVPIKISSTRVIPVLDASPTEVMPPADTDTVEFSKKRAISRSKIA